MNNTQLADKLKSLRKSKGLSQEALAEIANLSIRTIQRIEKENKNPSGDTLKRLSTALDVSPDYLIDWEPSENKKFLLILAASPILFIFNIFLAILVPLILWVVKKNTIKGAKQLGIKILTIEIIWLITYSTFRTFNFLRLEYKMNNMPPVILEGDFDSYYNDFNSQVYLKSFFIAINILIILYTTFKAYRNSY